VHGDSRIGLVACSVERATGAARPGHVGSAPRREHSGSTPRGRKSSQHLDGAVKGGGRVNTSTGTGVRVSTSGGNGKGRRSSQHFDGYAPSQRLEAGSRVSTLTGADSESEPRRTEVESTGRLRISSQHLEMSGEWSCSRVSSSSAWGRKKVLTVEIGRLIYPGEAYGPSGVGVWDAVVCALRYASIQVCSCMYIRAYMCCYLAVGG